MKNTTLVANCLLALLSSSALAQQSEITSPSIDGMLWKLPEQQCDSVASSWTQSLGPSVAIDAEDGSVLVTTPAQYEFNYECCTTTSNRIDRLLSSPDRVGFGEQTTGGALAEDYTVVTNLNDDGEGSLRSALSKPTPIWIIFDSSIAGGTIRLSSAINISEPDITIDGSGSDITISPDSGADLNMFQFRGGNTIIHDLTFDGVNTQSQNIMIREGDDYWIDHITVKNFSSDDAITVGQGSRPDTSASEITLSNYHVYDSNKGYQAGGNDDYPNFPLHRTTIHSSILSALDRNPRIQYGGQAHVFNTYIHSFVYVGMDAGREAEVFSENNVFSALTANNSDNAQTGRAAGTGPTGYVYSNGDLFLDVAGASGSVTLTANSPFTIPYDYDPMPASEVVDYVLANAGAGNSDNSTSSSCNVVTKEFTYSTD